MGFNMIPKGKDISNLLLEELVLLLISRERVMKLFSFSLMSSVLQRVQFYFVYIAFTTVQIVSTVGASQRPKE